METGCKWHLVGIGRSGHANGQLTGDAGDMGQIGRGHASRHLTGDTGGIYLVGKRMYLGSLWVIVKLVLSVDS